MNCRKQLTQLVSSSTFKLNISFKEFYVIFLRVGEGVDTHAINVLSYVHAIKRSVLEFYCELHIGKTILSLPRFPCPHQDFCRINEECYLGFLSLLLDNLPTTEMCEVISVEVDNGSNGQ